MERERDVWVVGLLLSRIPAEDQLYNSAVSGLCVWKQTYQIKLKAVLQGLFSNEFLQFACWE